MYTALSLPLTIDHQIKKKTCNHMVNRASIGFHTHKERKEEKIANVNATIVLRRP